MGKTALVLGATGLVGGCVLEDLLKDADYTNVTVLTRKTLGINDPKLSEVIVDFDKIEDYSGSIKADAVFCCLGTTIGKAGSQDAFRKVDYEYPVRVAKVAKQNGTKNFLLISALGSSKSSIIFYNRVKAEVEADVSALEFDTVHILQPSLIIGDREETRIGEGIAQAAAPVINFLMVGPLNKYKSIKAEQIAKAMVYYSKQNDKGVFRHESGELQKVK